MIYLNCDGGARGNPGPGAVGVVIRKDNEIISRYHAKIGNNVTNNVAEYEALIAGLRLAQKITQEHIVVFLDSELVYNQVLGKFKVKNPRILELFLEVQRLQDKFNKIEYRQVPRYDTFQQLADELVNEVLDKG